MSEGWLLAFAVAAVALLAVAGLAVGVRRVQARTAADLSSARAEAEELRIQLARLEARVDEASDGSGVSHRDASSLGSSGQATRHAAAPRGGSTSGSATGEKSEYVITELARSDEPKARTEPAPVVEPRLFADIVLRETTIRTATAVQGLRRALAPETRNRIRFEMRREVRRARKQRRAEMRAARREWQARKRAGIRVEQEGSAA